MNPIIILGGYTFLSAFFFALYFSGVFHRLGFIDFIDQVCVCFEHVQTIIPLNKCGILLTKSINLHLLHFYLSHGWIETQVARL